MDLRQLLLISETIGKMFYVLMEKQKSYYEECEGSSRTREKSVLAVYSNAQ